MKLCPKCGSVMLPKKKDNISVLICNCGYEESGETKITEIVKHHEKNMEIADSDIQMLPVVKEKCPKCGNGEAYHWEIQIRRSDEPPTEFFRCTKCKYTWREYGTAAHV